MQNYKQKLYHSRMYYMAILVFWMDYQFYLVFTLCAMYELYRKLSAHLCSRHKLQFYMLLMESQAHTDNEYLVSLLH